MPLSSNMSLPIPSVSTTSGPQWGTDLNSCLTIIDAHDHTSGYGALITPDALNINANLSIGSNNLTSIKFASFTSQTTTVGGTNYLAFVSGDLYVNDGSGNSIQITASGGVAGTPGSIGSLASPAAATYVAGSKLFTWQSGASKAGAMDNGAVTIRETDVASAKGITLQSPTSLAADYSLTLLTALPGSTQVLNVTSLGAVGTISYDTIGTSMTSTGGNAIAAVRTRATGATVGAGGVGYSSSSTGSVVGTTYADMTGLSVTITTSGRPVQIMVISSGTGSYVCSINDGTTTNTASAFQCLRDVTVVGIQDLVLTPGGAAALKTIFIPSSSVQFIDTPAAGTYTYKMQAKGASATDTAAWVSCRLVVYEL